MALNQPPPNEQRNAIIATVLIAIITLVWMWQFSPAPPEEPPTAQEEPVVDTSQAEAQEAERAAARAEEAPTAPQGLQDSLASTAEARRIVVVTDLYEAVFTTQGATLTSFRLAEYDTFDEETAVQLVDTTRQGALGLSFTTPQSRNVDSRSLAFATDFAGDTLRVTGGEEEAETASLTFEASMGSGTLQQTYTFTPGSYEIGLDVTRQNGSAFMTNAGYDVVWHGGLPFTEADPEAEATAAGAFARTGGDVVTVETTEDEPMAEQSMRGDVTWTAVKNKYFTAAVVPDDPARGAELTGERLDRDDLLWEDFSTRLQVIPQEASEHYRLYLGPMDYFELRKVGAELYDMVDYGWNFFEWMTRPLAKYIFIPLFRFLHSFVPSYGVVIILLAVIVKLAVYPLTKSSYKSMAKMRELQPRMEEIKEKHGDNPQKQQEAMLKLYKETGVNPLGGCMPMLLQYPIIIALWQFLPQSIEIRQQSFLWAHDLSVPDVILNLPFSIPLYGDYVAGFTLLMGLSMVVQMRIQSGGGAGGQQMKVLTYVFPFMIFFIFNQFAAGLSLYYLSYNVVTAIQQKYINKQIEQEGEASSNGRGSTSDARRARRKKAKT